MPNHVTIIVCLDWLDVECANDELDIRFNDVVPVQFQHILQASTISHLLNPVFARHCVKYF